MIVSPPRRVGPPVAPPVDPPVARRPPRRRYPSRSRAIPGRSGMQKLTTFADPPPAFGLRNPPAPLSPRPPFPQKNLK